MNEKPLERLNYYNGQRLEASDFKTEQDYHMRTRRWLNKSLYSAGIARGLEVRKVPGLPSVAVSPGLALDNDGREIILFEEIQIEVQSLAGSNGGAVAGNYLVIEYVEETIAYEKGGCAVRTAEKCASKSTTNWGGPSRIQAHFKFSWVPFVPSPESNQIVLARVELTANCTSVLQIDAGARHIIGASSIGTVRQYALEGEREIAYIPRDAFPVPATGPDNREFVEVVGRIYFHIRGRQSGSVTLYLRAEKLSQLHYTELPRHHHSGSAHGSTENANVPLTAGNLRHHHHVTLKTTNQERSESTTEGGGHHHAMRARRKWDPRTNEPLRFTMINREAILDADMDWAFNPLHDILADTNGEIFEGQHLHDIAAFDTEDWTEFTPYNHTHQFSNATLNVENSGVDDLVKVARTGNILTFVNELVVSIGPAGQGASVIDCTEDIKLQLANMYPINWSVGGVGGTPKSLGDGSGTHELATNGTGAIRLDYLQGMTFAEGEYCIELKINKEKNKIANGGKIHYNLYIE